MDVQATVSVTLNWMAHARIQDAQVGDVRVFPGDDGEPGAVAYLHHLDQQGTQVWVGALLGPLDGNGEPNPNNSIFVEMVLVAIQQVAATKTRADKPQE